MFRKHKVVEEEVEAVPESSTQEEDETRSAFDMAGIQKQVRKLLKVSSFEPITHYWLDTGSPDLNAVLGSRVKGIPYGKILELAGEEHGGKTTLSLLVAAMAQQDGACIGYIDLEQSRDEMWDARLGLKPDEIYHIYPKLIVAKPKKDGEEDEGTKKKKKKKRQGEISGIPMLQSAESLFQEAEVAMAVLSQRFKKQFWLLDSVADIQTEMSVASGTERNMRVNLDRAMFLSETLPRWASLAANYNATIFLINQLRDKQGLVFGDPTYSPGGRALRHACSIRARVRRHKGGTLVKGDEVIGLRGIIQNIKNKAGGGSSQNAKCGFKVRWHKNPPVLWFMPVAELED